MSGLEMLGARLPAPAPGARPVVAGWSPLPMPQGWPAPVVAVCEYCYRLVPDGSVWVHTGDDVHVSECSATYVVGAWRFGAPS